MSSIDVNYEAIEKGLKRLERIKRNVTLKRDFRLPQTKGTTINEAKNVLNIYVDLFKEFNCLIDDTYGFVLSAKESYEAADKKIHDKIVK